MEMSLSQGRVTYEMGTAGVRQCEGAMRQCKGALRQRFFRSERT